MAYLILLFALGTIFGSFLNVLIHRLPRGESILFPPSHCPQCNHRLGIVDLIPLLSYFISAGKCRYCRTSISFRYPLVELITGVVFVAVAFVFPLSCCPLEFVFYLFFSVLLIAVFFTDLEQQVVPDLISLSGIVLGLFFNLAKGVVYTKSLVLDSYYSAIGGMVLGFVLLFLIAKLGELFFKKEAMGEGDFYLAAMLGAFLGFRGVLLSLFLAYLLATLVFGVLLILGKVKFGEQVPFGPALAGGGMLTLFFGHQIINWYWGLLILR